MSGVQEEVASSGLGRSEDSRRRKSSPPGQTLNEARKHALAISRTGLIATRVHGADGPERLHTSVELLAADILLKLPGGPWWSIRDRLNKHLQAAMSSERIGAQHCTSAAVLQQLKMLGIVVSHDDLVGAARHLHAWHRGKGILISAFVDGLVSVAKVMGTEPQTVSMEWTLPIENVESWAKEPGQAAQDDEWYTQTHAHTEIHIHTNTQTHKHTHAHAHAQPYIYVQLQPRSLTPAFE